jgi:hypothetical protein
MDEIARNLPTKAIVIEAYLGGFQVVEYVDGEVFLLGAR